MPSLDKILLKKKYGQHFLNEKWVVDSAISEVKLDKDTSVFEIGGGSGFLTESILQQEIARLWVFEIDSDWVGYLNEKFEDKIQENVLQVFGDNFLDLDMSILEKHKPWTVLANLPYNVTFPILHLFMKHRHLLKEGVVMVQEEVAQKIVKTHGRGYGVVSLTLQRYFEWKLLDKIPPSAFTPPPKIDSRLMYFKPYQEVEPIPDEEKFWKFAKLCFKFPRRTLRNNLAQTHYDLNLFDESVLRLRAQEMNLAHFLELWDKVR
jgi:16S rRNA (adenine1518-N6/adenine1519-N6)-dimethyltransferase